MLEVIVNEGGDEEFFLRVSESFHPSLRVLSKFFNIHLPELLLEIFVRNE